MSPLRVSALVVLLGSLLWGTVGAEQAPTPNATAVPPAELERIERWESIVAKYEKQDEDEPSTPGGVVFVGSSSIRLWRVHESFPELNVLNRGFGGSHLADAVYYLERLVLKHRPRVVVVYAGDNDLSAKKTPAQLTADFVSLANKLHAALPDARLIYIGVKPSPARWALIDQQREANRLVAERARSFSFVTFVDVEKPMLGSDGKPRGDLFLRDKLHMSAAGYRIWTDLVSPLLTRN